MNNTKFIYTILFVGLISILGLTFFLNPSPNTITGMATYSGSGAGTEADPFIITTCLELNETRDNLTAYYELGNNIDCSDTINWNAGEGFQPIGNDTNMFTGSLDGNNFAISDLFIDLSSEDNVGLFGYVDGASITNLGIINLNISGNDYVGGLVGYAIEVDIDTCYTTGFVNSVWGDVGGLVGDIDLGSINNSYSSALVTGDTLVGGLIGMTWDSSIVVQNSYTTGDVTGTSFVGGLIGEAYGDILNCTANGTITGVEFVGGLLGALDDNLFDSYATGDVTGGVGQSTGGLVGQSYSTGNINNSYATGEVVSTGTYVGGLVGYGSGTIRNSYSTGDVTASDDYIVGGLIGETDETIIENCYATGDVTGKGYVGGLIADFEGSINNSYATGDVVSTEDRVGGFIGSCYSGPIYNSYAIGNVSAGDDGTNSDVGGFAGYMYDECFIYNSFSTGDVTGTGNRVGGFAGYMNSILTNIYWYNESSSLDCYDGGNENCTAIDAESYFFDYDNEPMLLTAGTGWDFIDVWSDYYNAVNYVTLALQNEESSPSDSTAPTITVVSPTNTTYTTSTIWFNATANEAIDVWTLNYNGTNTTITINTSATLSNGQYQLLLYGNDSSGNVGLNDSIWFTVNVASSTTEEDDDDSSSSSSTTTVTEYINEYSVDDSTFKVIVKISPEIPKTKKIIDHKDTNIEEITIETNEYTYGEIEIVNLNQTLAKCILPAEYKEYEVYKSVGLSSGISPNKLNRIDIKMGVDSSWRVPSSAIRIIRCPDIKPIDPEDEEEIPELTIEETSDGSYKISSNKITGFSIIGLTNPVASESQEQLNNTLEPEVIEYKEEKVIEEEVPSCSKFLGMCNYLWLILILILIGAGIYFKNKKN